MGGIIVTLGSIGVMCVAGFGVSTALKWFHSYEVEPTRKETRPERGGRHHDRLNNLSKRIKSDGQI